MKRNPTEGIDHEAGPALMIIGVVVCHIIVLSSAAVVAKKATDESGFCFPDSKTLRMCLEMVDLLRWNSSAIFWLAVMVFIIIPTGRQMYDYM